MTATVSLKDQLRKLIEIQVLDEQIFIQKTVLKERPAEIEHLRQEFEAKKVTLKSLEDKLKTIQVKQKDLDNDLKSKEDGISKADASLGLLKTNKEYTARLQEIENLKADKSIVEEKILMGFDEIETARKAVEAERAQVAQYEKDFLAKKTEVEAAMKIADDQIKVKTSQRERLTPDVKPDILSRYERIMRNKEGVGIVKLENSNCTGCNMHVTEQLLNQIRMYDQLVCCDSCARILYLPDELWS